MTEDRPERTGTYRRISTSLDFVVVVCLAVSVYLLWSIAGDAGGPVRVVLGVLFVLFLPGYALTVALFPRAGPYWITSAQPANRSGFSSLSLVERLVVSVGLSFFVVPLLVLLLDHTPWAIRAGTVVPSVLTVILVGVAVGAARRVLTRPDRRFRLPIVELMKSFRETDRTTRRVNAAIAVLLLLSVCIAGTALALPQDGETYTEFYLLSDPDGTGDLVAADYPSSLTATRNRTVHVGITNHESRSVDYTVLVELHRIREVDDERRAVAVGRTADGRHPGRSDRVLGERLGS